MRAPTVENERVAYEGRVAPGLVCAAFAALAAVSWSASAAAQPFDSGSTGNDGAFDLTGTPSGTTIVFDPVARGIDPERDNVFHFTTITVPSGVTVKMTAAKLSGPVYWLATGAVNIAGTVNLSGADGHLRTRTTAGRYPSIPGPGGYAGGVGGHLEAAKGTPQPGSGPFGGGAAPNASSLWVGLAGGTSSNVFLVPLQGGSGGGGGRLNEFEEWAAGGGGAGGGALLIASSISITVSGFILANGGYAHNGFGGCYAVGGPGAGGAIRMAAPLIQGGGRLEVGGTSNACGRCDGGYAVFCSASGRVRLEAYQRNWSFVIPYGTYTIGVPYKSFVPTTPPPSIRVVSVAGIPVSSDATGSFTPPDITFNSTTPVPVVVEARYVPLGTTPTLLLMSLETADQILTMPAVAGTLQQSTTTMQVTFPPSFTRGYVRAKWE
jgi:hypothetical protein